MQNALEYVSLSLYIYIYAGVYSVHACSRFHAGVCSPATSTCLIACVHIHITYVSTSASPNRPSHGLVNCVRNLLTSHPCSEPSPRLPQPSIVAAVLHTAACVLPCICRAYVYMRLGGLPPRGLCPFHHRVHRAERAVYPKALIWVGIKSPRHPAGHY